MALMSIKAKKKIDKYFTTVSATNINFRLKLELDWHRHWHNEMPNLRSYIK